MEDKIKQILKEHGLTESQLTCEELDKLKEEIKAKEQGMCILDSVLDNPSLYYREKNKHLCEEAAEDFKQNA